MNKFDKDAIVCPSATGVHIRLTREVFASEEEFLRWKVWSDDDYHDIEKAGHGYYDCGLSLPEAGTTGISAKNIFIAPLLEAEQEELRDALFRQVKELPDRNAVPTSLNALCPENDCDRHCQGGGHLESNCIQVHQRRAEKYFCFFSGRRRKQVTNAPLFCDR